MITGSTARKNSVNRKSNLLVDLEILRKEEFVQRRKIRIQQVRLQSKDIANKVLRDIRNEKNRQLQLNNAKQDDLFKKWQERKIFDVNLIYKENIKRLGSAYRDADNQPDPEKEIAERSQKYSDIAKERGKKAFDQLRGDQEVARIHNEARTARRDKVKKLEEMRSALISSLPPPGNDGKATQKSSSLEVKTDFCSSRHRESEEDLCLGEVNPATSRLTLDGGSTERRDEVITTQTSHTSTKHRNQSTAFTVELYDRSNPCTFTKRQPHTVRVERTSHNSQRNAREAAEVEEKIEMERQLKKENEKEIKERRGRKALAKELVRRDLDCLVKRLDGLAREERLLRGSVEPKLPVDMFMNERRSALRAQKRQRNMDSAFEGIFHGNEGVEMKVAEEDVQPVTIQVEKVNLPGEWLHEWQQIPVLPQTPPETLNVRAHSTQGTSILSATNLIGEDHARNKDNILKEAKRDSDSLINPESSSERDEKFSKEDDVLELLKEGAKEVKLSSVDATSAEMPGEIQECLKGDNNVPDSSYKADQQKEASKIMDVGIDNSFFSSQVSKESTAQVASKEKLFTIEEQDDAGSSSRKQRQESIPKTEASTQTIDLTNNQEGPSQVEKSVCILREEAEGMVTRSDESSVSSTPGSSMKIEEVCVVLRFNESSSKDASVEEATQSPSTTTKRMRKKKVIFWKKCNEVTLDEEMKAVINVGTPDTIPPPVEDDKESDPRISSADGGKKPERKKKRNKKDIHKSKPSVPISPSDSSNLSLDDITRDRKAKALLEEVRAQRKQVERWARLKGAEDEDTSSRLSDYVRKLLSMTRESVAELSVSDVSTPSIHIASPLPEAVRPVDEQDAKSQSQSKQKKKDLVSEMKKVDQATSPVPFLAASDDEEFILQKLQDIKVLSKKQQRSLTDSSTKSSLEFSMPSSSSSFNISSPCAVKSPEDGLPPSLSPLPLLVPPRSSSPLPPPPSPQYEQLTDLHSHRISELGVKLMAVREQRKKILSHNTSSDSENSSSSSFTVSAKASNISSETRSSIKSDDYEPIKASGPGKRWNLSDISLSTIEDSQDVLLRENILVELEKSSKISQEESSIRRKSGHKSGPPPTPLKGLKWDVFDYQIPHELSTITEVDSKIISTSSVMESRKEKDTVPSFNGIKEKLPEDSVPKITSPEVDQAKKSGVQSSIKTSDSWQIARHKLDRSGSPVNQVSLLPVDNLENIPRSAEKPEKTREHPLEEISSHVEVISSSSSTDSNLPENLDDVLRLLGISPTIFKRPESPNMIEVESPEPSNLSFADKVTQKSTSTKDSSLSSPSSKSKTKVHDENILVDIGPDVEQVSYPGKEYLHWSQSFGIRKSPFGATETSSRLLMHSTPVQSISSGTTSSSSDSKQKNTSGFPFLGESAPSSISGTGTPLGGNWINIDDDDGSFPKEDRGK